MATKVNEKSGAVRDMAKGWEMIEALMEGTCEMREEGEKFLPRWPNESRDAWKARLAAATLFPAFQRTIGVIAGKPFSRQLLLQDDVPPRIRAWCDDADMEGNNLHSFAAGLMQEALSYGIAGVLIDHTPAPQNNGGPVTVAQEVAAGARPYMIPIMAEQILGWQQTRINGRPVLTQLRIEEEVEVPDGPFGVKEVERVRVLTPGAWELYEENDKGDWVIVDSGTTTLQAVPFVPFYGRKTGFMTGVSPLMELAHLNVKHWQSQSDQDNILHVARVPMLALIGVDDDSSLTIGASSAIKLPQGGDAKFIEHTGAAIGAGAASLKALEEQMIQCGAELMTAAPGTRTATEAANDADANKSELLRIVESFEDAIDQCLQYMADWVGEPQGGHVSLYKDFSAATLSEASAQLVLSMQQSGLISKETAIRELQRRGMLAADVDPTIEADRVAQEGPSLGVL